MHTEIQDRVRETIKALGIKRPKSPGTWRLIEARWRAAKARHDALSDAADPQHTQYAKGAVRDYEAAAREFDALTYVALTSPAADAQSLLFRLEIFDADLWCGAEVWPALRADLAEWIGTAAGYLRGVLEDDKEAA